MYRTLRPSDHPYFSCSWLTGEKLDESSEVLQSNGKFGHLLEGVFAVVDGGRSACAYYVDKDVQKDL